MRFVDNVHLDQAYVEDVAAVYSELPETPQFRSKRNTRVSGTILPQVRAALRLAGGDYRRLRWDHGDVVVENQPRA